MARELREIAASNIDLLAEGETLRSLAEQYLSYKVRDGCLSLWSVSSPYC